MQGLYAGLMTRGSSSSEKAVSSCHFYVVLEGIAELYWVFTERMVMGLGVWRGGESWLEERWGRMREI